MAYVACLAVVQLALFTSKPIVGKEFFVLLFKISYKTICHKISVQESYRAAACDVTGGVASLNFDATELQIF